MSRKDSTWLSNLRMQKATQHSNVSLTKPRFIESVTPPPGYTFVEESVARCSKIDGQHVPFLRQSAFGTFINVSGQELHSCVQNFAHESGIPVVWQYHNHFRHSSAHIPPAQLTSHFVVKCQHNVFSGGRSPLTRNISMFEEFVKSTLELLIHLSITNPVVLLIGRSKNYRRLILLFMLTFLTFLLKNDLENSAISCRELWQSAAFWHFISAHLTA